MPASNLKEMLKEAKDTSELMVDLSYAALFFDDVDMATEVENLEEDMDVLVHDMRTMCILAVRNPAEAQAMSAVLEVISAVEEISNNAVDISKIVSRRVGIPRQLVVDLMEAEEVSHRTEVFEGSALVDRPLEDFELPVLVGMRVIAVRRGKQWLVDPDGDFVIEQSDILFLRGAPEGIDELRNLANAPKWIHPVLEEDSKSLSDLDKAVDVMVEMKNISEVAVGLAYSALYFNDKSLAAEVMHLEDRLDEMKSRLELWVLSASRDYSDHSKLRGLLQLAEAAEDFGNQAKQMVWLIERSADLHEVLYVALGDTDDVVLKFPVAQDSRAHQSVLGDLELHGSGFSVLAIERNGRYIYMPRNSETLKANDELLLSGPEEGTEEIAAIFGWEIIDNEETEDFELVAL